MFKNFGNVQKILPPAKKHLPQNTTQLHFVVLFPFKKILPPAKKHLPQNTTQLHFVVLFPFKILDNILSKY